MDTIILKYILSSDTKSNIYVRYTSLSIFMFEMLYSPISRPRYVTASKYIIYNENISKSIYIYLLYIIYITFINYSKYTFTYLLIYIYYT